MAKQQPDTPQPKKSPRHDEPEQAADTGAAGAPKKTQLAKKTPESPPPKKSSHPTMLGAGATSQGPESPPKVPKLSLDDEEVVEAEAADSGVVEVQPASDVTQAESDIVEAQPASDVAEAQAVSDVVEVQPASDLVEAEAAEDEDVLTADVVEGDQPASATRAPDTPIRTEQVVERAEQALDEDAIGNESLPSGAESSVRVHGKKKPIDLESTEALGADDSSASSLDLGAKPPPKKGSSQIGVDEVAEALESGVKLEASESPPPKKKPLPSVEFDDLVNEGEALSGKALPKHKDVPSKADKAAAEASSDLLAKSAEEAAAEVWNEADDAKAAPGEDKATAPETPIPSGKREKAAEAEEAATEEKAPPPRKKKGGGTAVMTRPPKPKYGRRWLGGTLLGLLLVAGGAAGVWYFAPELFDELQPLLAQSPNAKPKPPTKPAAPPLTLAQRAHSEIDDGRFGDALQMLDNLQGADKNAANLTTRAEARWLKYQKDQADKKADLNKDDSEVKEVLKDLADAKNELLASQIQKALEHKDLRDIVKRLQTNELAVRDLRDLLAKKMIINGKTALKDVPAAVSQSLAAKEQTDTLLQGIQKVLIDAKQLSDQDKLDVAIFNKLVKDLTDQQAALVAVNKLLAGAKVKDAGGKGVEELLWAKKDADDKLAAVNKVLADEKIKGDGAKGLQDIATQRAQLAKDRDDLDQALKAAYKELAEGQFVPAGGDPRKQLLAGAKVARQRAEAPLAMPLTQLAAALGSLGLNPARDTKNIFDSAALLAELNFYRLREPLIQAPEQKLDAYLALYQDRTRTDAKETAAALKDAAWVLSSEAKASATAKAKANAVTGLILRNQGKYAEAKQALEAAVAAPSAGPWAAQAKQALKEMTDPAAFYLPRVEQLQSTGQIKSAQQELTSALQAMPDDARLLAQRGLLRLEEARGAGKIAPEVQAAIRQDAGAALKNPATASDGAYVLGLLEEELGNYNQAELHLRQALKTRGKGNNDETDRIRIALARVLQHEQAPVLAPRPAAPRKEEKKAAQPKAEASSAFPLALALVLGQAGADDEEDPTTTARLKESMDLAKQLIESANPKIKGHGYMLLGQALAKQGKRTEGVREYIKGMNLLFPGMASKEMAKLVDEHPAFQQADAAKAPNAYLAEVHFGKGINLYWARQYPEAEGQFKQAAGFFSQDARYQYFLGLAQYAQNTKVKRDAAFYSIEQGARLEAANRPPVAEINTSLERVQGDQRRLINSFRAKAIELRN